MPLTLEQLRDQVLALPPDQRDWLFTSTSAEAEEIALGLHPSWEAEIDRRVKDFESGKTKGMPWEEAERELEAMVELP
jgi:putative addiction module component (TIGR02574 family)